jgi:hypothetical protein
MNSYEELKELKKAKRYEEAISVAKSLVAAIEKEAKKEGWGVVPAPYMELAKLYSKTKNTAEEIEILERFFKQKQARGRSKDALAERYLKLCNDTNHAIPPEIQKIVEKISSGTLDNELFFEALK